MALPVRNLDDRTFQDLVDEAKKKIPLSWSAVFSCKKICRNIATNMIK